MDTIRSQPTGTALSHARQLWAGLLDSKTFPSDDDCHAMVANLQFSTIRDRLIAEHAAPFLTTIGYINWWEGRGSKAHQYLQLALDTDPGYRLARLSDQMIGSGIVAG